MKIGIITIQKCNNYGAELQAYALQEALRLNGFDAENIDYLFYKHPRAIRTKRSRPLVPLAFPNRIKEFLFPFLQKRNPGREIRFEEFVREHTALSREYRSLDDLFDDPPKYDVYVTGSDQVWNPRMASSLLPYLLAFAPQGARCVSYASSFGVSSLPRQWKPIFKKYLSHYSAIGVREKSGVDIVNGLGFAATHVADPTLLLSSEEWFKVVRTPENLPARYLLVYDLIKSPELWTFVDRLAKEQSLEVVRIASEGPAEFLGLFANATAVVTNSFHGSVFSVLFKKPFWTIRPKGMTNAGRIESLVTMLRLVNRFAKAEEIDEIDTSSLIDWSSVELALESTRAASLEFLLEAINGET